MVGTVIVGGGKSSRFNGDKIFYKVFDFPLIYYSVFPFLKCKLVDKIVVVLNREKIHEGKLIFKDFDKVIEIVEGGEERKYSVLNGLLSLKKIGNIDKVLIHDGARPNIKIELIEKIVSEIEEEACVIPVVPVIESLKYIQNKNFIKTLEREKIFITQTPQGFPFNKLLYLLKKHINEKLYDDSMVFEKEGLLIKIVDGDIDNIKVTYKSDILKVADFIERNENWYRL
jgi:2-C-methyl-D-erythritol 4-phosphate cytidylyltransferase